MKNSKAKARIVESTKPGPVQLVVPLGYENLAAVCWEAIEQASSGKGKIRHADAKLAFDHQDIVRDAQYCGLAAPIFQIRKKAKESLRLVPEAAINELLGCIVYAAGAIIAISRNENEKEK